MTGGFDATSMDDVARAAGVSRLIVYRNFDSKADLYGAVLDCVLRELGDAFETPGDAADTARRMLVVARANDAAFRLLWRHAAHEPAFRNRVEFLHDHLHERARAAFASSVRDPLVLEWAARAGGAHLMDAICLWLDVGDPARDDDAVAVIAAGLEALMRAWSTPPAS